MKQILMLMAFVLLAVNIYAQPANNIDSTLTVFNDPSYKLSLHIFDPENENEVDKNATLTLNQITNGNAKLLHRDSLHCRYLKIEMRDFNMDGIKDILVLHTSSARSNRSFYLYIVNQKKHKIIPVKGFTNLLNPEISKETGVITSMALYGDTQSFSHYKITADGVLISQGKSEEVKIK